MKGTISSLLLVAARLFGQGYGEGHHPTQTEIVLVTIDTPIAWLMFIVTRLTDHFVKLIQISEIRNDRRL